MRKSIIFRLGLLSLWALLALKGSPASAEPEVIGLTGTMPDLKSVQVETGHVYDYTFTSAPTDWKVQSGIWDMTNRWSCSPQWSWFGGRSDEVAAVWNKRRFQGDISVQFYFAFKMGMSGVRSWPEDPSDAAVTILGDGRNLGSGYSFIVGADDNQRSILMRGGKVVAESREPEALLPTLTDGKPEQDDMHRRWWYVRINKIGSRVECWLDNNLLFTYDDPKPLDAGQLAVWTYNNGIMLSRVQIYYENEVRSVYKPSRKVGAPVKPAPAVRTTVAAKAATAPVKLAGR